MFHSPAFRCTHRGLSLNEMWFQCPQPGQVIDALCTITDCFPARITSIPLCSTAMVFTLQFVHLWRRPVSVMVSVMLGFPPYGT